MIAYPIEAAKSSKYIEEVFVSTDSEKIADIATKFGALVPFIRPKYLSDNITPTTPVMAHAVNKLIELGWEIDNVCCIYPCTPLLTSQRLDNVYQKMVSGKYPFAYPVMQYTHPIQRAMKMSAGGKMIFFSPEHELTRTQDLEPAFHDAGQFYWGTKNAWLERGKMHTDGIGVLINTWEAVDIDNEDDWEKAEMLKRAFQNK